MAKEKTKKQPQPPTAQHKTLAVFDLDNTLTDTLTAWAAAITPMARIMAHDFSLDEDMLTEKILAAPSQFRFNDAARLITWLDGEGLFPRAHDAAEQHKIETTKWALQQSWHSTQKKTVHPYPRALETLDELRAAGTDIALYTDAEASSMIRRLWLMARNARKAGQIRREDDLVNLFDHFYCQPSAEDDQRILRDIDLRFVQRVKRNTTLWTTREYKPVPAYMNIIMKDFGATPQKTVMIGDTHNDGGGAVPLGVSFAWAHYGANIAPEVEAAARRMASGYYKYGAADISAAFNAQSRPDVVLQDNIAELRTRFAFGRGNGFIPYNGTATAKPRRNGDAREFQNPPVCRLGDPSLSRQPQSPLGPATHFPPKP